MCEQLVTWVARTIRYGIALLVAAATSAFVFACQAGVYAMMVESLAGRDVGGAMLGGLIGFVLSGPAFLAGLIMLGLPTWFVAARFGRTSHRLAAVIGAVEATLVGVVLLLMLGGLSALSAAIALPLSGAIGGATFRALICDSVRPPPVPPSATPTP